MIEKKPFYKVVFIVKTFFEMMMKKTEYKSAKEYSYWKEKRELLEKYQECFDELEKYTCSRILPHDIEKKINCMIDYIYLWDLMFYLVIIILDIIILILAKYKLPVYNTLNALFYVIFSFVLFFSLLGFIRLLFSFSVIFYFYSFFLFIQYCTLIRCINYLIQKKEFLVLNENDYNDFINSKINTIIIFVIMLIFMHFVYPLVLDYGFFSPFGLFRHKENMELLNKLIPVIQNELEKINNNNNNNNNNNKEK